MVNGNLVVDHVLDVVVDVALNALGVDVHVNGTLDVLGVDS